MLGEFENHVIENAECSPGDTPAAVHAGLVSGPLRPGAHTNHAGIDVAGRTKSASLSVLEWQTTQPYFECQHTLGAAFQVVRLSYTRRQAGHKSFLRL